MVRSQRADSTGSRGRRRGRASVAPERVRTRALRVPGDDRGVSSRGLPDPGEKPRRDGHGVVVGPRGRRAFRGERAPPRAAPDRRTARRAYPRKRPVFGAAAASAAGNPPADVKAAAAISWTRPPASYATSAKEECRRIACAIVRAPRAAAARRAAASRRPVRGRGVSRPPSGAPVLRELPLEVGGRVRRRVGRDHRFEATGQPPAAAGGGGEEERGERGETRHNAAHVPGEHGPHGLGRGGVRGSGGPPSRSALPAALERRPAGVRRRPSERIRGPCPGSIAIAVRLACRSRVEPGRRVAARAA